MSITSKAGNIEAGIKPSTVAAITAALVAGGYLSEEQRITGIRRRGGMNPWRKAGVVKQMLGRDMSI